MNFSIKKVINLAFNSNTYIIESNSDNYAFYLIDIGNANGVLDHLNCNQEIKGIFLTHDHYDHISGINQIITRFPNCLVYCSQYVKEALSDSKINLSFYHNDPIEYKGENCQVIREKDKIELFPNLFLEIFETPGHNKGCLSFKIENLFFTGDSLIPEIAVVTKLRGGNKIEAKNSIRKLNDITLPDSVIYPGHGNPVLAKEMDWDFYLM
ncbi:MBL fold metallo-hydrolase [Flavobacterium sp.]|uniref:MBL fold metallo-hydrolase n=2 Tax=Flavobacterium sp. TaxID=239 RepID=UPI004047FBA6